ncbi:hypothetical protein AK830_g3051 [Neonectria ditissima]|uniref:Uncharacterized protein n=1 Tax=Neonectria ditissima TaxID=78410 RepID=A0A0P7BD27_9HYPO|nr:hypothetical protein AK830_g3051 [Neonectria ditissima]
MPAMLSSNSLQPPKTGTSRWSKALPEVPGIDFDDIYDEYDDEPSPVTSQPKSLPRPPFVPPPPRSTSMANAQPLLPSSLPPLHLLNTSMAPLSGPPKMAIPRRPVGKQPHQPPQQLQQSPPEPHSPAQSINSILSAYSRTSGESLIRSSDAATNSTHQSEANTSPSRQAPPASTKTQTLISPSSTTLSTTRLPQTQQQHGAPNLPFESNRPAPPPPTKDTKFGLPKSPAPNRAPAQIVDTSSPPQPQLWRRRSTKAERSLELPDLKLITSHGSTAATHSAVQQPVAQPAAQSSAQPYLPSGVVKVSTLAYQQPQSNQPQVAPAAVPAPEQAAETETQIMGSGSSKLTRLKDKLHTIHRRGKSSSDTTSDSTGRPGAQRPPTPEYQKQDVKTPLVDSFISPLSPASSPEPLTELSPPLAKELPKPPPQVPVQHEPAQDSTRVLSPNVSPVDSKPVTRKALPPLNQYLSESKPLPAPKEASEPIAPAQANNEVKPHPEQKLQVVTETKMESPAIGSLPPLITEEVRFPNYSVDSPTSRAPYSADVPTRFPPRGSSVRSNAPRPLEQFRQPAAEPDPRLVSSESQGFLYRGRDGTLYPEMKVTRDPDPEAAYFPRQADGFLSGGEVFKAPTLKDSHFSCYQGHRTMNRRSNRNYSLACQSCEKPDSEDRWACTFCHLRICESCFTMLDRQERDLRHLIEGLNQPLAA